MGFRSDAELHHYLETNGQAHVYSAPAQRFYDMSMDWYRGRTDVQWRPLTAEQAMAVWRHRGFRGEFWEL